MASMFCRSTFVGGSLPAASALLALCPWAQNWRNGRQLAQTQVCPGDAVADHAGVKPRKNPRRMRSIVAGGWCEAATVRCDTDRNIELQGLKELVARLEHEVRRLEDGSRDLPPIYRVVVTGGPCGGKSTIIGDLKQALEDRNYLVSVMPEIATQAFDWTGGRLWEDHKSERLSVDKSINLIKLQISIEDAILRMARNSLVVRAQKIHKPRGLVVLYDRGCADYKAYCSNTQWSEVLESLDTTMTRLRERRYDFVVHLVTAAKGAEKNYTLVQADNVDSKSARHETPEEACALDLKTQQAWQGFPHENYRIVDNSGDWTYKRERVKDFVMQAIGEASSDRGAAMRRLLCELKDLNYPTASKASLEILEKAGLEHCRKIDIHMVYLSDKQRLQRRSLSGEGHPTYYRQTLEDERVVRQHQIDCWTYSSFIKAAEEANVEVKEFDEDLIIVTKDNSICRYHIFYDAERDDSLPLIIFEYDPAQFPSEAELPEWLTIVRDVTTEDRYSTFPLA